MLLVALAACNPPATDGSADLQRRVEKYKRNVTIATQAIGGGVAHSGNNIAISIDICDEIKAQYLPGRAAAIPPGVTVSCSPPSGQRGQTGWELQGR